MSKIKNIFYTICRLFTLKKKTILLFSYYGTNYGGSPKYITEYIINQDKNIKVVWAFIDINHKQYISKDIKVIKYNSFKYFYYLATSKIIITNYRMTMEFKKRKNQVYIQTWHSSLRLKMIEKDAEDTLSPKYIEMAKNDSKQIDLLLVGSKKSEEIYKQSFWYNGKYLECGTTQCDIFFKGNKDLKNKIKEKLSIPFNTKVILYAPTFRKDGNLDVYDLDFDKLYNSLIQRGEGEWKILLRLHPHLIHKVNELKLNETVVMDVTSYDDIQELLYVSDMVITDYSALMFDYALTFRPCFLYVSDIENYTKNDRKLYFDIKHLPFVICENKFVLQKEISQINFLDYKRKIGKFLNDEIVTYDQGDACKKVYEYIKGVIYNEKI